MSAENQAEILLEMALKDWRALAGMSDEEVFAEEIFGFHAQQAVEKILKAWACFLNIEYPKTHDLNNLLYLLKTHGIDIDDLWEFAELNPYGVQFRYEAFDSADESIDRVKTIRKIEGIIHRISEIIKSR